MPAQIGNNDIAKVDWVAGIDDLQDKHFHIGQVVSTGDFVQVEAWATTAPTLKTAKWRPLYQIDATGQYTTEKAGRRQQTRVVEDIPELQAWDFIMCTKIC